jgi:hypothetical protein
MAMSEAPNAVVTKSRREKDGLDSGASFLSSIACSLIAESKNKNGRHIRTANRQRGWTPLSVESLLFDSRPAAIDRALWFDYCNGRASFAKNR